MKNLMFIVLVLLFGMHCKKTGEEPVVYNTDHTIDWMQDIIKKYPDKEIRLKDICIPRAHDAGMYEVNNCFAGNACNTKTQDRSMLSMLESGIRVFDIRPVLKDGVFWTYHATGCEGFGCDGVLLKTLLDETKTYLEAHNELLIFDLTHFCNTNSEDLLFQDILNTSLGNTIYKSDPNNTLSFIYRPLKDIINENTGGKVVLLMEDLSNSKESEGYFSNSFLPVSGRFADSPDPETMKADQLSKFIAYDSSTESLFRISWTLTQDDALAVNCFNLDRNPLSIEDITTEATQLLEPSINQWIADQTFQKNNIPNIISVDFANTLVTEQCIKITELNLD